MKPFILFFISLFYSAIIFSQVNLGAGLMAYYPFNGNANDASGNNNNPVFNNATLTTDRFGVANSAYSFNGTSSYMRIPNTATLNFGTQMSVTAWVKVSGFYSGPCHGNRIIMKGDVDYLTGNYLLTYDDNGFTNGQNCANPVPDNQHQNFYAINTPPPAGGYTPFIQTNQWYMITYTTDGTTAKFYLNCELKISGPAGGATFSNTYDLFFGRMNNAQYPYWFNGSLDEVRIYNRSLTTDEVNLLGGCAVTSNGCIPTFQKLYGGNKSDLAFHIEAHPDGSYITAGSTNSFGNGGNDGYLQKMDKAGNLLWSKAYGGTGNDYFTSVKPTTDGGYMVVGSTASFGGSANGSAWMLKTDGAGNLQWSRRFDDGNVNGSILWDVVNTADGGYALSGTNRYAGGVANGMVIKTDNNGVITWAKNFDSFNSDQSMSLIEDGSSLIVISIQYGQSSSFYDGVIMKLNTSDGSVTWARNYDIESKSNWPRELFKTSTGYSFSCYEDVSFSTTAPELVVVNTDQNGNPLSLRKISGSPTRYGYYVPTADGGLITAQGGIVDPNDDIHLVKISAAGVVQWTNRFGGTGWQYAYDIAQSADGGFLIAGINNVTGATINDSSNIYILKTDSLGNTPGCNTGITTATVSTPAFTVNSSFTWASVNNLSFSNTAITPVTTNPNPFINTLCSSSCQPLVSDTIINDYTGVLSFDKCTNILNVADCAKFKNGDTVLLIQMKGAVVDSSNTASFGSITNYRNAGNYEFNIVKNINGNLIELKNKLTRSYDLPTGKVQLVRVPYLNSTSFNSRLTCLPWDGEKGGVLVLNVRDTINLNADIDVSGKGFRGGNDPYTNPSSFYCNENNFFYPPNPDLASEKGEGIALLSSSKSFGKGANANGGGGGNSHNSGGGGGSNAAAGGFGGYNFEGTPCTNAPFDNRGIGGIGLTYSTTANKIFMGGGGGAGHSNNPEAFVAKGGNGAGIIIIMADKLKSNGKKIISNGNDAPGCGTTGVGCHEGMGGGGAAGTILMKVNTYLDNNSVEAKGGKGADMTAAGFLRVGPGGGGSGGILWLSNSSLPSAVTYVNSGGSNGVTTAYSNSPFGATAGANGNSLLNLQMPVDNSLFRSTFDSAKLNITVISCTVFRFTGLTNVDTLQIVKWQWNFGDGTVDSVKNVVHEYVSPGVYPVTLIATDAYGCVATFKVDMIIHCRCEEIKITSPNPATDRITVSGLGCGVNTLVLYNMLGQKITELSGDHSSETILVGHLPKGMYIVKVINKDKVVANLKVVKM